MKKLVLIKRICLACLVCNPLQIFSQAEADQVQFASFSESTTLGIRDGQLTSKEIGPEGGEISSDDGKLLLKFPAGALAQRTGISIQPTTNPARGGMGKAYQLLPAGTQFAQPVHLVFNYTEKETEGDSPQLLGISTQDETGKWQRVKKVKLDTSAKTISGYVDHFSSFALSWGIILEPLKTSVKVSGEVKILLFVRNTSEADIKEHQAVLDAFFGKDFKNPRTWFVNDIQNGDNNVGKIIPRGGGSILVNYNAPAQVPDNNPVTITVEIQNVDIMDELVTVKKSCKIWVYDRRYEVTMVSRMKGPPSSLLGELSYDDKGSFVVSMEGKRSRITDIKNSNEVLVYKGGSCKQQLLNPGANFGMIHISSIPVIKIVPASPPEKPYPVVEMTFRPSLAMTSIILISCPERQPVTLPGMGVPALPFDIKFTAKEGEQVIKEVGDKKGVEQVWYKFTVKQLKED